MTRSSARKYTGRTLPVLAAGFWLGAALVSNAIADESTTEWPAAKGAVFALRNGCATPPMIGFDEKGRDLLAFNCAPRGRGLFGRFFELICDGGSFHAKDAGTWTSVQVAKSGAFTIEVTITPAEASPKAVGVIFAFCDDKGEDVALIQDKSGLALRLAGAQPVELFALEAGKPVTVVISCDKEKWAAYRDGKPVKSGTPAAPPAWGKREITLGAMLSCADTWHGRMETIAIFPRTLTAEEAAKEAEAVKAIRAERKPATMLHFKGTLARQAITADLQSIRPYTRSMTAAEYKVEKVLSGEWKKPTITVLHWMIMDRKRLPLADRKTGTAVELKVEAYNEHPELVSCRRDDIEGAEVDPNMYYCESEDN